MKKELVYLNDKVVKKVFNSEKKEGREYLIRIISLTTGLDINALRDNIELVTPEINSNKNFVESTVDSMYLTNDRYINIEINYNNSLVARIKNNTYLYNVILRQVDSSKKYKTILPVIQININNYDIYKENKFIYKSKMIETTLHKIRDELITIYDINLEKIKEMDYNKLIEGKDYDLAKLLYIFIENDNELLDNLYNGDELMNKVREKCNDYIKVLDEMLYYNEEDLKQQIIEYETEQAQKRGYEKGHNEGHQKGLEDGRKEGLREGREEGRKEGIKEGLEQGIEQGIEQERLSTIKNMLDKGFKSSDIKEILNLDDEIFNQLKNK